MRHSAFNLISQNTYERLLRHAAQQSDFAYLGSLGPGANRGPYAGFSAMASHSLCKSLSDSDPMEPGAIAETMEHAVASFTQPCEKDLPCLPGGWIGFISYEFGYETEARLRNQQRALPVPLLSAGLYLWMASHNRKSNNHYLWVHPDAPRCIRDQLDRWQQQPPADANDPWHLLGGFEARQTQADYKASVDRIKRYISAGDCYQANLSQAFAASYSGDPWLAFCQLSEHNPTPHSAFIRNGQTAVMSVSPERFLTMRGKQVTTSPIKGTRRRGETAQKDAALAQELLNSEKDRAENLMIVDLLRNDLSRNAAEGSVSVEELFALESYQNVHHLVSHIRCELAPGVSPMKALFDAFPGGSITGAPKIRAMEIIRELEPHYRGPYCGSVFFRGLDDSLDSNVAIRTLYCDGEGNIHCCGGGGVVSDSDPESEYQETLTKVKPLMDFLESLNKGE